jgi:haloalkane dehalogenase
MATITRGYANTPIGQVHYRSAGERRPDAPPLVLLHQTPSSSVMFERLMAELAGEVFMIAPDTPGFGGTLAPEAVPAGASGQRVSVPFYAEVMLAALHALSIDRCALFGHHSGASIAVAIADARPEVVTRIALSGPPLLTRAELEATIPKVSPSRLEPDGAHLLEVWRRIRAKANDAPIELCHREAVQNLHAGLRYGEAYEAVFAYPLEPALRRLRGPTLVMVGPDDPLRAAAEPAARACSRGRLVLLPAGGAYICDTHPDLVAGALRGLLRAQGDL